MLGEQEKPKIIDNAALDPDWLTARYKMEKREMWWDTNQKARYDRNFCGTLVNIFYFFILLTELILWIKVRPFQIFCQAPYFILARSRCCCTGGGPRPRGCLS